MSYSIKLDYYVFEIGWASKAYLIHGRWSKTEAAAKTIWRNRALVQVWLERVRKSLWYIKSLECPRKQSISREKVELRKVTSFLFDMMYSIYVFLKVQSFNSTLWESVVVTWACYSKRRNGGYSYISWRPILKSTVWILLRARTTLLSCQAKQSVFATTFANRVFQGKKLASRPFKIARFRGNCACGRVVPTAPYSQARSSKRCTEVKQLSR